MASRGRCVSCVSCSVFSLTFNPTHPTICGCGHPDTSHIVLGACRQCQCVRWAKGASTLAADQCDCCGHQAVFHEFGFPGGAAPAAYVPMPSHPTQPWPSPAPLNPYQPVQPPPLAASFQWPHAPISAPAPPTLHALPAAPVVPRAPVANHPAMAGYAQAPPTNVNKCSLPECPLPRAVNGQGQMQACCGSTHEMELQRREAVDRTAGPDGIPGVTHCLLTGCHKAVWPFKNYCSKNHAVAGERLGLRPPAPHAGAEQVKAADVCILPGCNKPRCRDSATGKLYEYCGKGHRDQGRVMGLPTNDLVDFLDRQVRRYGPGVADFFRDIRRRRRRHRRDDRHSGSEDEVDEYDPRLIDPDRAQVAGEGPGNPGSPGEDTLQEVVEGLRLKHLTGEPHIFRVNRLHLLDDLLAYYSSKDCDLTKPLAVEFEGERGMDGGGLTREFFTLVIRSAMTDHHVFVNPYPPFHFHYSVTLWKDHFYQMFGKIVAHSIVSGGPGLPGFPRWMYTYITTGNLEVASAQCTRSDLPTDVDRALVEEAMTIKSLSDASDDLSAQLTNIGWTRALSDESRPAMVDNLILYLVTVKNQPAIDQFLSGLKSFGVLNAIRKHPKMFEPHFLRGAYIMTGQMFLDQCEGQPHTDEEQTAMGYFQQFCLENPKIYLDRDDEEAVPAVEMLMMFCSGVRTPTPFGAERKISLMFQDTYLPTASTCGISLTIPTRHETYTAFENAFQTALSSESEGFGHE